MATETEIQKEIINYLRSCDLIAEVHKNDSDLLRARRYNKGKAGLPDIHGMFIGGQAFYIEVKKPGGIIRPEQLEFMQKIKSKGGAGLFAFAKSDVEDWINAKRNRIN